MRISAEFRIPESHAAMYLGDLPPGQLLGDGGVRRVVVDTDDPMFQRIGELQRELFALGDRLFYGWELRQRPSTRDIDTAEAFLLVINATFEPPGEEFGTEYDYSGACPMCGSDRRLSGPLRLNTHRIPKRAGFAKTIALDEWIVSERVRDLLVDVQATGVLLTKIEHVGRRPATAHWWNLQVSAPPVELSGEVTFGADPFRPDTEGSTRCPVCFNPGSSLLTPVITVDRRSWPGTDFFRSRLTIGGQSGCLYPAPLLMISPRIRALLHAHAIKGAALEVVRLGGDGT